MQKIKKKQKKKLRVCADTATDDIIEAIDDFLKYDYPDQDDDFIRGMKKAREYVKDWGCKDDREN